MDRSRVDTGSREGRRRLERLVWSMASVFRHRQDVRRVLGPDRARELRAVLRQVSDLVCPTVPVCSCWRRTSRELVKRGGCRGCGRGGAAPATERDRPAPSGRKGGVR